MTEVQSRIDAARASLVLTEKRPGPWSLLGATAMAATAAVLLAGVMVLGPGVALSDAPPAIADAG